MKSLAIALALSLSVAASSASALVNPFFPDITFPTVETDSSTQGPALPLIPETNE